MRLLMDMTSIQPAGNIITNGGGEYALKIFNTLLEMKKDDDQIDVIFSKKKGKCLSVYEIGKEKQINYFYYNNLVDMSLLINNGNYNLVFFPVLYPDYHALEINNNQKIIGIIHDLSSMMATIIEKKHKEYIITSYKNFLHHTKIKIFGKKIIENERKKHKRLFELTDNIKIYTVSYFSKFSFQYFLKIKKIDDITVIYSPLKCQNNVIVKKEVFFSNININNNEYLLLINGSRWLKNNFKVMKVFDGLISSGDYPYINNLKMIITGVNENYKKKYLGNLRNKSNYIFLDFVKSEELELLYKHAKAFIFPSLLEGFGYPPIEAMKYQTLCLCSTSTSIPEICGNSPIYFDPYDDDSIGISILSIFNKDYVQKKKVMMQQHYTEIIKKQKDDLERICKEIMVI